MNPLQEPKIYQGIYRPLWKQITWKCFYSTRTADIHRRCQIARLIHPDRETDEPQCKHHLLDQTRRLVLSRIANTFRERMEKSSTVGSHAHEGFQSFAELCNNIQNSLVVDPYLPSINAFAPKILCPFSTLSY